MTRRAAGVSRLVGLPRQTALDYTLESSSVFQTNNDLSSCVWITAVDATMPEESLAESKAARRLALVLRGLGLFDLLALVAVAAPEHWIDMAHHWAGLGAFPGEPIVGYLARSTSAL